MKPGLIAEPALAKPECCPDNKKNGRSVAQLEGPVVMAFRKKMAIEEVQDPGSQSQFPFDCVPSKGKSADYFLFLIILKVGNFFSRSATLFEWLI